MTLSRQDLIESVYNQSDLSKPEATLVVKSLLEIIKRTLESGENILISGFGKFCVKDKKERKGRNPQTGEDLVLRARRVVRFKCSEILAGRINGRG